MCTSPGSSLQVPATILPVPEPVTTAVIGCWQGKSPVFRENGRAGVIRASIHSGRAGQPANTRGRC
jgi:hypothetical protein